MKWDNEIWRDKLILKTFDKIKFSDIEYLKENEIPEGKQLDYKELLKIDENKDKKELLEDIVSFANTDGGDIIFGIREDDNTSAPETISGIEVTTEDQFVLKIQDIIKNGIEPILSKKPEIKFIKDKDDFKKVLLLRIHKSWNNPHRVRFKSPITFFKRRTAGKDPMDVLELRRDFVLSEKISEEIKKFKNLRVGKILNNYELTIDLPAGAKFIIHIIPVDSFINNHRVEFQDYRYLDIKPMGHHGHNHRLNLDGIVIYTDCSYKLLFRDGMLETVYSETQKNEAGQIILAMITFENMILNDLSNSLEILKKLNLDPPFYCFISLLNMNNTDVRSIRSELIFGPRHGIDRNELILPEFEISNFDTDLSTLLKPSFDMVWNAYDYKGSQCYDEEGNRIIKKQ